MAALTLVSLAGCGSASNAARSASSSTHPVVVQAAARKLPLDFSTGSATQVVTVVATDTHATTASLQMWNKVNGGWTPVGSAVTADIGRNGMSAHVTEGAKAAPIGSFTMTQAFGRDSDPGTALPYFQTTPDDWWISEPGPLYNTHQRCASDCAFNTATGNPNEHLYYEIPYYNYAVVIDYNTANAGPVVPGAGSAFFLHVTTGKPTLGCVAIPTAALLPLMRWLNPADHPRILIATA
ncbi:MAG TPA: L,D-transpeptidase family protein [Pseudonocardiaceae bacterium]